ncbi:hypothetical protein V6N13_094284 [Hibiscus sabdariffa]|uniref:peroxidase n=1 Tax=Hibiscus sabdariffa TaxID=183260 RepID=A0ABR2PQR2_9ROSI
MLSAPISGRDFTTNQAMENQITQWTNCPRSSGEQNLIFLDFVSPTKFDNSYFKNLLAYKGVLSSDQVLFTKIDVTRELVKKYTYN